MAENLKELLEKYSHPGKLDFIGIRTVKRSPLEMQDEAVITVENGIEGDHYRGKSRERQVTLIQAEHLATVANILQKPIDPSMTRRNLVISGINILSLQNGQFSIGDEVILETTGLCHPCSRMEENLGTGGYNAMRGHGGITARVVKGGVIRKGDLVKYLRRSSEDGA